MDRKIEGTAVMMINIAVDVMGGDNAPVEIIAGALDALEKFSDITITMIGTNEVLMTVDDRPRLMKKAASEVIEMAESPVKAIKSKKDSSMVVGMTMVRDGLCDAFVTAGSTGAAVAGGTLIIRRIEGIQRPALAPLIPTADGGRVLLIDCGANVDCKSSYLRQFGIMGSAYMKAVMGIESPRVCLINNGAEEEKGNAVTKEAYQLLKDTPQVDFRGNAEGRDILSGKYDVAVCDGFVGNVFMKGLEGFAMMLLGMLKENLMSSRISAIGALLSKGAFKKVKKQMDYTEYGGTPLLGIKGCLIKAHGNSDAKSMMNAIGQAVSFIKGNVLSLITKEISESAEATEED